MYHCCRVLVTGISPYAGVITYPHLLPFPVHARSSPPSDEFLLGFPGDEQKPRGTRTGGSPSPATSSRSLEFNEQRPTKHPITGSPTKHTPGASPVRTWPRLHRGQRKESQPQPNARGTGSVFPLRYIKHHGNTRPTSRPQRTTPQRTASRSTERAPQRNGRCSCIYSRCHTEKA